MNSRRQRRSFSTDFKKEVVGSYKSGKSRKELIQKYDLTPSAFDKWVNLYSETDEVESTEHLSDIEKEIIVLRKENAELRMENEVLKQAALIFGKMVK